MSGARRILVVDDNAANIRLLEAILATHGYAVDRAADGPSALASMSHQPPDLVLLDVQMPGMDGFEVCRRLRDDPATEALPIIMVTASGPEEKVTALDAGADDFLPRPFDQAELLARVRSLLRMKTYHDAVLGQAAELASWNRTLEVQVAEQVEEVNRLQRLRRFLSSRVAELVLSAGDDALLEAHRREVAILFCDLRGFTAFSVAAEPEEVLGALKQFHRTAGALISANGATVGPYTGDGIVVIFNDPVECPQPALRAVRMAVDLREAMTGYSDEWRSRGHTLTVGIGVTYGFATMGVLGFEDRADYMAVGPVVNLASRLCDAAAGGEILVSQRVCTEVGDAVETEPRGLMQLRGFPHPQPVWSVVAARAEPVSLPAADVTQASDGDMCFDVLGPLQVRYGSAELEVRAARERLLLLVMLVNRGRVLSVDRLADELWEGDPPESAVAALRVQVSRLRKTLAGAGLEGILVTKPTGYLLDVEDGAVDAVVFERLTAQARAELESGDAAAAAEHFRAALSMWRGAAFADAAGARFAELEVARLEECRLVAVEDCMEAELAAGGHRQLIGELESLVASHPLRERLWSHLMVALHRSGRQPDALAAYHSLRQRLADELGLEPSPELARLHQAILTRDASLEPAAVAGR